MTGKVALVGAGPGDPKLITVRAVELLQTAQVVIMDRLISKDLLAYCRIDVKIIDAGKEPYKHQMTQDEINAYIIEYAKKGLFVLRLKGGDPYVFGRGFEEVLACQEAGIEVEVVPGVTSAISVPASIGIPITHRGVTQQFSVVSGHVLPSDPRSMVDWKALSKSRGTIVLLMAVTNIQQIAQELIKHGLCEKTPVVSIESAMSPTQRVIYGDLGSIGVISKEQNISPPAIFVIGEVVGLADKL